MEEVCSLCVHAIRLVQPHSPYTIGGWLIGGMYAYEVARQLIERGEMIQGLILHDKSIPLSIKVSTLLLGLFEVTS